MHIGKSDIFLLAVTWGGGAAWCFHIPMVLKHQLEMYCMALLDRELGI